MSVGRVLLPKDLSEPGLERWARMVTAVAFWLPLLLLGSMVASLAIYMVDLPHRDDWRAFDQADIFDVSRFFEPVNHTMSPVGKILNVLFVVFLNGNTIVFQVLSAVFILGLILYFQYKLLNKVTDRPWILAASFFATVLMLQPGSYWGAQYIAYLQAVPCVCLFSAFLLTFSNSKYRTVGLATVTLISGFSYISGAFAFAALAIVFLIHASILGGALARPVRLAGAVIGTAVAIPMAAQTWVILGYFGGHRGPNSDWMLPTDIGFWSYALGKFGRAFGLMPTAVGIILTLILLAVTFTSAAVVLVPLWSRLYGQKNPTATRPTEEALRLERLSVIFTGLVASIGIYLAIVSAGRADAANYDAPIESFVDGFRRFHFFWLALLAPWFAVVILRAIDRVFGRRDLTASVAFLIMLLTGLAAISGGVFAQATYYETKGNERSSSLRCIWSQVQSAKKNIHCQGFPGDLMPAYVELMTSPTLSFTRHMPDPQNLPFLPSAQNTLFRLSAPNSSRSTTFEKSDAVLVQGSWIVSAQRWAQVVVELPARVRECQALQVTVTETLERDDRQRIFYWPITEVAKEPIKSDRIDVAAGAAQRKSFLLRARGGFEPKIILSLAEEQQHISLDDIEVGCLPYFETHLVRVEPRGGFTLGDEYYEMPPIFIGGEFKVRQFEERLDLFYGARQLMTLPRKDPTVSND